MLASANGRLPSRGQSSRSNEKSHNQNRRGRGISCGQHQSQGQPSTQNDGFNTHAEPGNRLSGSGHHGGVPPRPPLPLWPPPLESVTVPLTTLAETRTRASQASSALATDKPTAIRHLPCVRRQHCRGEMYSRLVQRPAPTSLDRCLACWVSAQHVVPYIRPMHQHSHNCFCEEPTGSFAACHEVLRRYAGDGSLRLERFSS